MSTDVEPNNTDTCRQWERMTKSSAHITPFHIFNLIFSGQLVEGFRIPTLSEEFGCSPTLASISGCRNLQDAYFDPFGFATDANFANFREAELKHGRVAMMAVVATTLPPIFKNSVDWIPEQYPIGWLESLATLEPIDYIEVVATCGFLETTVFVPKSRKSLPGDYGTGYFGIQNKGAHERSLTVELENGRLAMIAVAGQVAAEVASGQSWLEQWDGLFESVFQWIYLTSKP